MATVPELVADLEAANAAVVEFAASCGHDDWATKVPGEDWSVGVVIHHIAEGHALMAGWLSDMLSGAGVHPEVDIDDANAQHAIDCAEVTVAETVALLQANYAGALAGLGALLEEDLAKTAPFGPARDIPMTVERIAALGAIHAHGHLGHAMAALGRS